MSRRRLLNITSTKKQDNMQQVNRGPTGSVTSGPITVGTGFESLFTPNARPWVATDGQNMRNSQSIFVRGYKEKVQVTISGGEPWMWRRIMFTVKGANLWRDNPPPLYDAGGGDMRRLVSPPQEAQYVILRGELFKGVEGTDWGDVLTAKVDTQHVNLLSDRTFQMNPANDTGMTRNYSLWYPINKTIVYNDDENGASKQSSYLSTVGKAGLGDIYIFDYVTSRIAGGSITWGVEGTFYWHER